MISEHVKKKLDDKFDSTNRELWRFYHSRKHWLGGTNLFKGVIEKYATGHAVMDLGASKINPITEFLKEKYKTVIGLDIDHRITANEDCFPVLYDGKGFPFKDSSFDTIVANYVLEHIPEPAELFKEISRVLQPDGRFIFRAPNRWYYLSFMGLLLPETIRELVSARLRNVKLEQVYKSYYRANTFTKIHRLCNNTNLDIDKIIMCEAEPMYLRRNPLLFSLGVLIERFLNSSELFEPFRSGIIGVLRKRHYIPSKSA